MTAIKKWPWKADSPAVKARKVALAYRHAAEQQQQQLVELREAFQKIDRRLIAFDDPTAYNTLADLVETIDDDAVVSLDARFTDWGETWHCPKPDRYDDDEWVDAATAAEILQYSRGTVLRYRVLGKIPGTWDDNGGARGGFKFRVGDLHAFAATRKPRGYNVSALAASKKKNPTDNITDSGRGDRE